MESQSITILSSKGLASNPIAADRVSQHEGTPDLRNVLIVALAAMAVLLPIMIFGIPNGADLPNHLRFALPFYESIQSGTFSSRLAGRIELRTGRSTLHLLPTGSVLPAQRDADADG